MELKIKGFSDWLCSGLYVRERRLSAMSARREIDNSLERPGTATMHSRGSLTRKVSP